MQTTKWGPGLWNAIHCMTFNYPLQPDQVNKENFKNYLESLKLMLPCAFCRESFTTYLKYFPIEQFWDDRHGMVYMLFTIHNLVNAKLSKPQISFEECVFTYEKIRARCSKYIGNPGQYTNCIKANEIFNSQQIKEFNQFIYTTENKYKSIVDKCIENLGKDPKSPNNQVKICRLKVYCDYR